MEKETISTASSAEPQKLVDDDFVIPTVPVSEELLWKVKRALGEYSKFLSEINNTLKDTNADVAANAKAHSEEVQSYVDELDKLKPSC